MPTMQPSFTVDSSDGVAIAAFEHGGSGPLMVVAHATGFCGPMYDDVALGLIGQFRVVSLDFRGHGQSTRPANDDFGWNRMADDLLAVLDHLGAPALHGVGHSMGGATLLFAELRRPGTFRSLYLYEPIVFPDEGVESSPNFMAAAARARRPEFASRADAMYRYAGKPPLNQLRASVLASYVDNGFAQLDDGRARLRCLPADEASTFEAPDKLTISRVHAIDVPTVVAVGADEAGPGPSRFAPLVAEAMPRGAIARHPTLGHFGPFQDPVVIADEIRAHALANP